MRIDHINIVTKNCDEHILFFTKIFGFKVTLDTNLAGHWIDELMNIPNVSSRVIFLESEDKDACRIELLEFNNQLNSSIPNKTEPNKVTNIGIRHFAVNVDDIDKIVENTIKHGYKLYSNKVVEVPIEILPKGKKLVYINAPEGVIIEACEVGYL